jgi:hypothetical protein
MCPHSAHRRRWSHQPFGDARHSTHPSPLGFEARLNPRRSFFIPIFPLVVACSATSSFHFLGKRPWTPSLVITPTAMRRTLNDQRCGVAFALFSSNDRRPCVQNAAGELNAQIIDIPRSCHVGIWPVVSLSQPCKVQERSVPLCRLHIGQTLRSRLRIGIESISSARVPDSAASCFRKRRGSLSGAAEDRSHSSHQHWACSAGLHRQKQPPGLVLLLKARCLHTGIAPQCSEPYHSPPLAQSR